MRSKPIYRGYHITYWAKPIPTDAFDYDFAHEDWDLDDPRIGAARSVVEACKQIDEIEWEREPLLLTEGKR